MLEFEALIAEHLEPARRQLERERILHEQMRTAEVTVTSPDRSIKIVQTCAGEILNIDIAPGAFDKHDEKALSKILTTAVQTARQVGRQAAEQFTDEIIHEKDGRSGR